MGPCKAYDNDNAGRISNNVRNSDVECCGSFRPRYLCRELLSGTIELLAAVVVALSDIVILLSISKVLFSKLFPDTWSCMV